MPLVPSSHPTPFARVVAALAAVLRARPWLSSLVLAALGLAVGLIGSPLVFYDNDDLAMMRIAEGSWTGTPDPHLVFTHIGIGWLLSMLYRVSDDVGWYVGYLVLVHCLSLWTLFYVFSRRGTRAATLSLCGCAYAFVWLPSLWVLQFTTTSVWAAFAAVALLATTAEPGPHRGRRLALALALAALASMVRFQGLLFGLVLATPLGLLVAVRTRSRVLVTAALGLVLLGFGLRAVDRAAYDADPEWRAFMDYSQLRAALHDTAVWSLDAETRPALTRAGWTPLDAKLFRSWFFPDEEIYSREKLAIVVEGMQAAYDRPLSKSWDGLVDKHLAKRAAWPLLLFLALGLFLVRRRQGELVALFVTQTALALGVAVWLMHARKIEPHVLEPLYGSVPLAVVVWAGLLGSGRRLARGAPRRRLRAAMALSCVLALAFGALAMQQYQRHESASRAREKKRTKRDAALKRLLHASQQPSGPSLYVVAGAGFRARHPPVGGEGIALEREVPILGAGWTTHGPLWRAHLARHGIDDVVRALYERDDVLLIARRTTAKRVERWVERRRGVVVNLEPVPGFPEVYKAGKARVYRLRRVEEPVDEHLSEE